ncbi:nucleotidyltransferase family protein [Sinorhizobium alkalisoli]|uniref:Uncharacterized protein n=1 Tax=Sinorhizobium alkalisoli TaxID=1752398 RepID=A0A1E3VER4_9HYPH|nr:nucleotidyltransferase family protein [Sinorhizobium alkalisoli]MCA1494422.1 nucleotidyltransferase family protein [Ensifer sp. NBAIM29]ODR92035.1 hypothetical protein A8M32_07155 [Sinorhizobium alkalisoli]QFI70246.1 hypothetical protein EKH55_5372 [Sinorhizobium alkalisoli]
MARSSQQKSSRRAQPPLALPRLAGAEAEDFVATAIADLVKSKIPFLIAGTFAVSAYTGISRLTKDLDIFCKAGDFARILNHFQSLGYTAEIEDERWLGKVYKGKHFFDVIFSSSNGTMLVSDAWFEHALKVKINANAVSIVAPTELVWSKSFIQLRERYDGADVAHMILKSHDQIDWRRLLDYMDAHWEVLLIHLLNFRWIYPSERDRVPPWLLDELLRRLAAQGELPLSQTKICRGRMYSRADYEVDVTEWGFADVGGDVEMRTGTKE